MPVDAGSGLLEPILQDILRRKPDAVFSTVIGRSAQLFYRMYADAGIDRKRMPIASLTMAESEIQAIGAEHCSGHVLGATYFQSLPGETNDRFVRAYKARFGERATTSIWSEPAYAQVHLFAKALQRTGSLETHKLAQALLWEDFEAPEGRISFDSDTRHVWLRPRIGIARDNGQFDIVWQADNPVRPDPYLVTSRFEETWLSA